MWKTFAVHSTKRKFPATRRTSAAFPASIQPTNANYHPLSQASTAFVKSVPLQNLQ